MALGTELYPQAPSSARIVCVELVDGAPAPVNLPANSKVFHLVRHGEAAHNLIAEQRRPGPGNCGCPDDCIYKNEDLTDAGLTEKGRKQAMGAGAAILKRTPFPELAVSSPLTRTLQTAQCALALGGLRSVPRIVIEGCRERTGLHLADMRSPREKIEGRFPGFDFSAIERGEDIRFNPIARERVETELTNRARGFWWGLKDRPEKCIAVFSHSSFLTNSIKHAFFNPDPAAVRRFENGEHRCVILTFENA